MADDWATVRMREILAEYNCGDLTGTPLGEAIAAALREARLLAEIARAALETKEEPTCPCGSTDLRKGDGKLWKCLTCKNWLVEREPPTAQQQLAAITAAAAKVQECWDKDGDTPTFARLTRNLLAAIAGSGAEASQPAPEALESRVAEWVRTRIGPEHMQTRERAMRLLEEAVELAQAEGTTARQVEAQCRHVFRRSAGEPAQEAAGVAVCLLAWCAATGNTFADLARREVDRIERKPIEQIRGSLARKRDADLVVCVEPAPERESGGEKP